MGQHKHNPTAALASEGKLPPKPAKMSKRARERLLYAKVYDRLVLGLHIPLMRGDRYER